MKQVQFISISPEQLQNEIIKGVKIQLEEFKQFFQPKEPTIYLSRQETADLLKVDLSTIHNYTRRKILTAWGIQGKVFYKRSEVEKAIVKLNK